MWKFLNEAFRFCLEENNEHAGNPPPENKAAGDENKGDEAPKGYRPEGLSDHLYGISDNETIDKLFSAYDGARKELSKKSGVPDKLDDYKIELPEEISKVIIKAGEDGKDPIFEHMRGEFHKRGVKAEDAVAIMTEWASKYGEMQSAMMSGEGMPDFEYKGYGGAEKAQPVIDGGIAWATGLKNAGKLDDVGMEEIKLLTSHEGGLRLIEQLRVAMGGEQIPANIKGKEMGGAMDEKELQSMMRDPKYWRDKDPAFIDKVTKGFQALYNK